MGNQYSIDPNCKRDAKGSDLKNQVPKDRSDFSQVTNGIFPRLPEEASYIDGDADNVGDFCSSRVSQYRKKKISRETNVPSIMISSLEIRPKV